MKQGPQTAREALEFWAGIYQTRGYNWWAKTVLRVPSARLDSRAGVRDPYPIYEDVRSHGRVVPGTGPYAATADYEVCREMLRSRDFGVRDPETRVVQGRIFGGDSIDVSMLGVDGPDHARLRRLAAQGFTPKLMRTYEQSIEKRVHALVDAIEPRGSFDLVHDLAGPLPIGVITDLLGLPDADVPAFERYGEVTASALDGVQSLNHARKLVVAAYQLEGVFDRVFELRRREPREDLVTSLVRANDEDRVTGRELVAMCQLLLVAGFETTANLVSNAVLALQATPGAWAALVAAPAELAPLAVEETLRFDPPVQRTIRVALSDVTIGGSDVRRGTWLVALLAGAHRDPGVFERPANFVIDRYADPATPDHLAFSAGAHYCLGATLARLEATVALRILAERLPRLRITGEPTMRKSVSVRGRKSVPAAPR